MHASQPLRSSAAPRPIQPPRARAWPLVGSLPGFLRDPFGFVYEAQRTHGDLYRLDLGLLEVLALGHPRHAQHVFRDRARIYTKGGIFWDSIRSFMGHGLPLSEGELWRRQRRMIQPHFHRGGLEEAAATMLEVIDSALDRWEAHARAREPFDAVAELTAITMQVIVRTMLGADIHASEIRQVSEILAYVQDYMFRGAVVNAMPPWLPMPGRRRYREGIAAIDAIVARFIARERAGEGQAGSLLATLVDAVDAETGAKMDDRQLRDEVLAFFLAGYETTSMTVAWALYHLAQSPTFAETWTAELDLEVGAARPRLVDLTRLRRSQWALKEALRLSGPLFWIWRTAAEDDEIDGIPVPAGATVSLMVHALHRHPELWPQPEVFDPERFSPARAATIAPNAWIPFGLGQRQCIGLDFAMMEGQLILARVGQRYRLRPAPGHVPRPYLATTIVTKGGLWLLAERRAGM